MYAMRYGAVPIVTAVGGLRDTVSPVDALLATGNGIVAERPTAEDLLFACEDALALYADKDAFRGAVTRGMARDSSWTPSAEAYAGIYRELVPAS